MSNRLRPLRTPFCYPSGSAIPPVAIVAFGSLYSRTEDGPVGSVLSVPNATIDPPRSWLFTRGRGFDACDRTPVFTPGDRYAGQGSWSLRKLPPNRRPDSCWPVATRHRFARISVASKRSNHSRRATRSPVDTSSTVTANMSNPRRDTTYVQLPECSNRRYGTGRSKDSSLIWVGSSGGNPYACAVTPRSSASSSSLAANLVPIW